MATGDADQETGGESARALLARARLCLALCLPRTIGFALPGAGEVVAGLGFFQPDNGDAWLARARRVCEELLLDHGGRSAALLCDQGLAQAWVCSLLGIPRPGIPLALSPLEHGIWTGMLTALLSRQGLSPDLLVSSDAELASPVSDGLVVAASIEWNGETGRAWLLADPTFFLRACRPAAAPRVVLARTFVAACDVGSAGPGDAVVFDETVARPSDQPWPVELHAGDRQLSARWLTDGTLEVEESAEENSFRAGAPTESTAEAGHALAPTNPAGRPGTDRSPRVEIIAEAWIGAGGESDFLARARIERGESTLLRANDRPWAVGRIETLDGSFAVRIERLLGGAEDRLG